MTISYAISIEYRNVTERQTDGRTNRIAISILRVSTLSRDKNTEDSKAVVRYNIVVMLLFQWQSPAFKTLIWYSNEIIWRV